MSKDILRAGLLELGIEPTEERLSMFMTYLSELKKWNRAYSLTALKTDKDIVIKHFLDSCLYLRAIPKGSQRIVDVGSGAGFPGVALKIIMPEIEFSLVEPSRKKSAFLRHIIRILGLKKIDIIEKRVEDIKDMEFDIALTRALFSARDFLKKTSHIVKRGGLFILSKGPEFRAELNEIKNYYVIDTTLPLTDIIRHLIVIRNED